ncbi:MAG: hypothetical protein H0U67_14705 [Gemmatimonadetes bacterium]|nr:hypothetical protein [Gemmatimonadota bacterium]
MSAGVGACVASGVEDAQPSVDAWPVVTRKTVAMPKNRFGLSMGTFYSEVNGGFACALGARIILSLRTGFAEAEVVVGAELVEGVSERD